MTSADFLQLSHTSLHGLTLWVLRSQIPLVGVPCKISPGKNDDLPLIYLSHLHHGVRAVLDFVLLCRLVRPTYAYYVISVRQAEGLH